MKALQLRTRFYEDMIEWISFDRLVNIKKIGEGGFGSIFSATWLDEIWFYMFCNLVWYLSAVKGKGTLVF